ncbi:MAG TPA: erythromycin esterase family protein, partial [Polyangiaceae bacterium]|nr:erythromycin esterase family protein [Polyangiaceae bacterium]
MNAIFGGAGVLVACTIAHGAADGPGSAAISGTVVDASGRAIRGARVALAPVGLFDPSGARFVHVDSAADGTFRLAPIAGADRYGITATAPDATAAWVADVRPGNSRLRLRLAGGGRHLSGRVIDREGRPRAGAEVRLARGLGDHGDVFLIESGPDGRWSAMVPDGDYSASALHAGDATPQRALPAGRDSADLVVDSIWPSGPPPLAVVDWLRKHEMPFTTAEPGHGFADLALLRPIVEGARVVGLGEATHGTHEIFQLKHRVLEYLVSEMGFTAFAIEISLPEAFAIDDYVLSGRGDPEKLLAGQFVAVWQTEELCDLVRWMRAWNRTHARKVRFHGLDMRAGVRAAKDTLAYLARVDRAALSLPAALALAPMADPVTSPEILRRPKPELAARAREVVARFDSLRAAYVARSSDESWWRSAMEARVLAQFLEWRAADDMAGRVRVREQSMAENVIRILEHEGPEARAVVWAHNAHIAGDPEGEPRMMGVHLRAHLGAAYRAFGSALERGAYQAIDASGHLLREFTLAPAAPGSLEDALAAAGRP